MNKWITRIIVALLLVGAFAGIGATSYHIGYNQGAQTTGNEAPQFFNHDKMSQFHLGFNDQGYNHGFASSHFSMMRHGRGFGFFSPFQFLCRIVILGLIIWLGYKLFSGNGWQLSLTRQPVNNASEEKTTTRKSAKSNK